MKKCTGCGNVQESGNFCGSCGGSVVETEVVENVTKTYDEAAVISPTNNPAYAPNSPSQPNVHVQKVKSQSMMYWEYFINSLKKPSEVFKKGENELVNNVISLILYAVIIGISIYTFINSFTKSMFGEFGGLFEEEITGPSFSSIFGNAFIFVAISICLIVLSLIITSKAFGPHLSWKVLINYLGVHTLPAIVLSVVGLLLLLLKSYVYGNVFLVISYLLVVFISPFYLISKIILSSPKKVDPYYGYLMYVVLFAVLYYIFLSILGDSVMQYIEEFQIF